MTEDPPDAPDGSPELDRRLVTADRMASMGVLAAGLAHELNNPLAYVSMTLQGLEERMKAGDDGEELREEVTSGLRTALDGCERMRVILHDLLTFARKARPAELTTVDVCGVLDTAVSMAHNEVRHRARLVRSYTSGVRVVGDETRLGQLFLNLLINAAHAIVPGEANRHAITLVVETRGEDQVCVEVRDTGEGIPPENRSQLFEPFFTTKGENMGTGLGLAICRGIVEEHGGTIEVESAEGRGSTFRVLLPRSQGEVLPLAAPAHTGAIELHARILMVDDELRLAEAVRKHLELVAPGVVIVVVDGGQTALELLAKDDGFDVIVCDLMMPRTTGIDVYEEVAAKYPKLLPRFVVMTGGAFTDQTRKFLDNPALEVLHKPFSTHELLQAVERVLSSAG